MTHFSDSPGEKLAAYHLAESVLGDEVARQHALTRAIEATEAKRQEIAARLDRLEQQQRRSRSAEHAP